MTPPSKLAVLDSAPLGNFILNGDPVTRQRIEWDLQYQPKHHQFVLIALNHTAQRLWAVEQRFKRCCLRDAFAELCDIFLRDRLDGRLKDATQILKEQLKVKHEEIRTASKCEAQVQQQNREDQVRQQKSLTKAVPHNQPKSTKPGALAKKQVSADRSVGGDINAKCTEASKQDSDNKLTEAEVQAKDLTKRLVAIGAARRAVPGITKLIRSLKRMQHQRLAVSIAHWRDVAILPTEAWLTMMNLRQHSFASRRYDFLGATEAELHDKYVPELMEVAREREIAAQAFQQKKVGARIVQSALSSLKNKMTFFVFDSLRVAASRDPRHTRGWDEEGTDDSYEDESSAWTSPRVHASSPVAQQHASLPSKQASSDHPAKSRQSQEHSPDSSHVDDEGYAVVPGAAPTVTNIENTHVALVWDMKKGRPSVEDMQKAVAAAEGMHKGRATAAQSIVLQPHHSSVSNDVLPKKKMVSVYGSPSTELDEKDPEYDEMYKDTFIFSGSDSAEDKYTPRQLSPQTKSRASALARKSKTNPEDLRHPPHSMADDVMKIHQITELPMVPSQSGISIQRHDSTSIHHKPSHVGSDRESAERRSSNASHAGAERKHSTTGEVYQDARVATSASIPTEHHANERLEAPRTSSHEAFGSTREHPGSGITKEVAPPPPPPPPPIVHSTSKPTGSSSPVAAGEKTIGKTATSKSVVSTKSKKEDHDDEEAEDSDEEAGDYDYDEQGEEEDGEYLEDGGLEV